MSYDSKISGEYDHWASVFGELKESTRKVVPDPAKADEIVVEIDAHLEKQKAAYETLMQKVAMGNAYSQLLTKLSQTTDPQEAAIIKAEIQEFCKNNNLPVPGLAANQEPTENRTEESVEKQEMDALVEAAPAASARKVSINEEKSKTEEKLVQATSRIDLSKESSLKSRLANRVNPFLNRQNRYLQPKK